MNVNLRNRILYLCLLLSIGALCLHAQEPPPAQPPQQVQPPAQQPPPEQPPAQAKQQPAEKKPARAATPPVVREDSSDGGFAVEPFYWYTGKVNPILRGGAKAPVGTPPDLNFPGTSRPAYGLVVSVPGSGDNNLRISYFVAKGSGDTTLQKFATFTSVLMNPGTFLTTRWTVTNAKISYDFLSWPNPPTSRFRLKTLWELQGLWFQSQINDVFRPIVLDANGNPLPANAISTDWFVLPTFGLAIEHLVSRHFYWQVKGSGFGIPKRADLWDAEGKMALRFGHWEAQIGGKAFHFKTSPARTQYTQATLWGPFVAVQWSSR
jgi:hypothetical protein